MKESPQERKQRLRETLKFIETLKDSVEEFNEDLNEDLKFYRNVLQLFRIGAWEESEEIGFYVCDSWLDILGLDTDDVLTLDDYFSFIDDFVDRERIIKSRKAFKDNLWEHIGMKSSPFAADAFIPLLVYTKTIRSWAAIYFPTDGSKTLAFRRLL